MHFINGLGHWGENALATTLVMWLVGCYFLVNAKEEHYCVHDILEDHINVGFRDTFPRIRLWNILACDLAKYRR